MTSGVRHAQVVTGAGPIAVGSLNAVTSLRSASGNVSVKTRADGHLTVATDEVL